jgi:hypothetical protein
MVDEPLERFVSDMCQKPARKQGLLSITNLIVISVALPDGRASDTLRAQLLQTCRREHQRFIFLAEAEANLLRAKSRRVGTVEA